MMGFEIGNSDPFPNLCTLGYDLFLLLILLAQKRVLRAHTLQAGRQ